MRYIGDPVAAVFAEDAYVAEDAADLVAVEYEDLPVVVSASDPPGEFEPGRSSEAIVLRHSYGDIDAAFSNAHTVIALDLSTGLRSSGGHFRWYSVHIQRNPVAFSFHVSTAACSSAEIRCAVTDFSLASATRRSL